MIYCQLVEANMAAGYRLVLMAEEVNWINNAQMASVKGHPFWLAVAQMIVKQVSSLVELCIKLYCQNQLNITILFHYLL